jgi:type IV pilus assembly protein PilM
MSKMILGIDFRVRAVKVVELEKRGKEYLIHGWGMDEVPLVLQDKHPQKEIAQAKLLKNILKARKIETKEAVVIIGGENLFITKIFLPQLSHQESLEAIRWKLKDDVPFDIEDSIIDFLPLSKPVTPDQEIKHLVVIANNQVVTRVAETLHQAGIKPKGIIPVPLALKHTFHNELEKDVVTALIYMGRQTTNIAFFRGDEIEFNREIPVGGEDITRAMTSVVVSEEGKLELKYDEAEKIKTKYGIPVDTGEYPKIEEVPLQHLQAVVRPTLEKIEGEIVRTIEYYKNQVGEIEIGKIVLSGGSSKTPHFVDFLTETIGTKILTPDPLTRIKLHKKLKFKADIQDLAQQFSAALGAALSFYSPEINLLPVEIRERWRYFFKKHIHLREISIAIVLLLSIIYGGLYLNLELIKQKNNDLQREIDSLTPRVSRFVAMEEALKEEKGKAGAIKKLQEMKVFSSQILEEISASLPKSVLIQEISFSNATKAVVLRGVVFEKGDTAENNLSKFIVNLSSTSSFSKVDLVRAQKTDAYLIEGFDFVIKGTL